MEVFVTKGLRDAFALHSDEQLELHVLMQPVSANAFSGTVSGTSTANAIAQLLKNHAPRAYNRDMIHSLSCEETQKP